MPVGCSNPPAVEANGNSAHDTRFMLFSRDGSTIVTLDELWRPDGETHDWTANVWGARDLKLRRAFNLGKISLWSAALSPDGLLLAIGLGDWSGTPPTVVDLWDNAAGTRIGQSPNLGGTVSAVQFTPDNRSILAGTRQPIIAERLPSRLWRLSATTLNPIGEPLAPAGGVRALAVSDDGSKVVVGEDDAENLSIWDLKPAWVLLRTTELPDCASDMPTQLRPQPRSPRPAQMDPNRRRVHPSDGDNDGRLADCLLRAIASSHRSRVGRWVSSIR